MVIAASILFGAFVINFDSVWGFLTSIVKYLVPFVYGFGIAFIINPMMKFFERLIKIQRISSKARRNIAICISYLMALLLVVVFFVIVIPNIASSITSVAKNINFYTTKVDQWLNDFVKLIPIDFIPAEVISAIDSVIKNLSTFLVTGLMQIVSVTGKITTGVIDSVMGIIVSIYMLANKESLFAQCKRILYAFIPEKAVQKMVDVAHSSNKKFTGFIIGKIIDSLIIGIICAIGMWIFKMPFISLVSLIIGVTNIIPYFGPFIGAIPGVLLVLIGGGFGQAIGFLVFILVLQQFDGNILGPAILGQSTGLDAMWVIFAILLFGGLYGFVGMIIGVPLLSVIFEFARIYINSRLKKKGLPENSKAYASKEHPLLDKKAE